MHWSNNCGQGGRNNATGNKLDNLTRQIKNRSTKWTKKLQQTQKRGRQLHQKHSHAKSILYMHDIKMHEGETIQICRTRSSTTHQRRRIHEMESKHRRDLQMHGSKNPRQRRRSTLNKENKMSAANVAKTGKAHKKITPEDKDTKSENEG